MLIARCRDSGRRSVFKTPWAASTLPQGYKDERGLRPILSQSFDLTSYNVIVPPREVPASLGSLARKRSAEDIDSGENKRAKAGSVLADKGVFSRSLLLANKLILTIVPVSRARRRLLLDENQPRCLEGCSPLSPLNEGPEHSWCRYVLAHAVDVWF